MHPLRFFAFIFILVLLVVLVGPLIMPIPPLPETIAVADLADSDSHFIEVNSIQVHYKMAGSGKPVMVLLHGFGSSIYTWHKVMDSLAAEGTVIAFDRPAFGLTDRPVPGEWTSENPYSNEFQVQLTVGLMDALNVEKAVLVGHSAGGTVALQTALTYPDRVSGLVLVDAAVFATGGMSGIARWLADTPQMKRLGPYLSRSLAGKQGDAFLEASWHDYSKFTAEDKAAYRKPLQIANWDVALWEYTKVNRETDLGQRLGEIRFAVLVISGDDDRIIPPAESQRIAEALPDAKLVTVDACGHVPQEECPEAFLKPVLEYIVR
jgi:pimeloyl-ACP methyl ester carboxylesterase